MLDGSGINQHQLLLVFHRGRLVNVWLPNFSVTETSENILLQ